MKTPKNLNSPEKKLFFVVIWIVLGAPWFIGVSARVEAARRVGEEAKRAAEEVDASRSALTRTLYYGSEADKAAKNTDREVSEILGPPTGKAMLSGIVAYLLVPVAVRLRTHVSNKAIEVKHQRDQQIFEAKLQTAEAENATVEQHSKLSQSKQELIARLGSIDNFVRVIECETDRQRRAMSLQAAQSELTTIEARLASGDIAPSSTTDPIVSAHARETLQDLAKCGLQEDRLTRDITRLFCLTGTLLGGRSTG